MNIIIITGGSKGIGNALALKYLQKNYKVYTLSRSITQQEIGTQLSVDLSNLEDTQNTFIKICNEVKNISNILSITLINNAGRLGNISNLENITTEDIAKSIHLNTTTPLVLSSLFIKNMQQLQCKKQIINISSGAAKTPYEGWSVYCTSKAAIDMMTKTIAAEQDQLKYGVKCVAIYPGVVDTNMQTHIRKTSDTDFKNVQRFIDLKYNNQLYTPEFVANKIFEIDTNSQLQNGDIIDIRNF